jgi:hypothetical protein
LLIELSLSGYFEIVFVNLFNYAGTLLNSQSKEKKGYELDIIGESVNKEEFLIGECKWTQSVDEWDIKRFLENLSLFKLQFPVLFSKYKKIQLVFVSRRTFPIHLQEKYPDINFFDLSKLNNLFTSITNS